jgi:hypothetical protein
MHGYAKDSRLPKFNEALLSHAKIRDRTYEHIRFGSELIFRIHRHLNAWRNEARMKTTARMRSIENNQAFGHGRKIHGKEPSNNSTPVVAHDNSFILFKVVHNGLDIAYQVRHLIILASLWLIA